MLRPPPKQIARPRKQRRRLHREGLRRLRKYLRRKQRLRRQQRRSHQFMHRLGRMQLLLLRPPRQQLRNPLRRHLLFRRKLLPRRSQNRCPPRHRPPPVHRWGQNLLRQLLWLPPLHLYRPRRNNRDRQHRLLELNNHPRALRQAFLRQGVRRNLGSSLRRRARWLQDRHCGPACPGNRGHH
jgi:hypothetical protein